MALEFDWLGIADGSTNDSRGALALVGVGHNVIVARSVPHQTQRVLIVMIVDESGNTLAEGTAVSFDFKLTAPSGRTLMANTQMITIPPSATLIDLPSDASGRGFQLVAGLGLQVTEYGVHTIRAAVTVGEVELVRSRNLHVIPPRDGFLTENPG